MRVGTKLTGSVVALTALLFGILLFYTSEVRQLANLQRDLARIEFSSIKSTLRLQKLMGKLAATAPKTVVIENDLSYLEALQVLRLDFEDELRVLVALEVSSEVREATDELNLRWNTVDWNAFASSDEENSADDARPDALNGTPERVSKAVEQIAFVRDQLEVVVEVTEKAVQDQVDRTAEEATKAEVLSWILVTILAVVCVAVLFVGLWSIRAPLRDLEEGVRSISRGVYAPPHLDASKRDEFSNLAVGFNRMVERLGELDQMKRDFLSHISHELRTPLVAMDETNRLLLEGLAGPLTPRQRKFLELNLDGSRRLAELITRLLDLSRLEERAVLFELTTNDLVALATHVSDSLMARARDLRVTIEVVAERSPVVLDCDADRMVQLLSNLIDNALKYSPPDETVLIRIDGGESPDERPDGRISNARIEVQDSGPGVPDSEKRNIFEKFHQVGRGRTGGVGLGLTICTQIVEAHGGSIWVEDNPKGGSIFTVSLPMSVASIEQRAQTG